MSKAWEDGSDSRWRRFRLSVLDRDKWLCTLKLEPCTGKAEDVHHIIPLSRGGQKYDMSNCTSACSACNKHLGNRTPAPQPDPKPTSRWDR